MNPEELQEWDADVERVALEARHAREDKGMMDLDREALCEAERRALSLTLYEAANVSLARENEWLWDKLLDAWSFIRHERTFG